MTASAVGGAPVRVGIVLREQDLAAAAGRLPAALGRIVAAGIDHVTVGDHVSYAGGAGVDGLIQATALLAAHPRLHVQTGVYLLALRHPATVARQLATISLLAPGRLTFGVGVGGDDPRELELCGVDPRTRGVRTSEALALVRAFMEGEPVTFRGREFTVEQGLIAPAVRPPMAILVGGRSDAALRRTGRLGDGWIGVWVSARRFAQAGELVRAAAGEAGRTVRDWQHTLQFWAGFGASPEAGEARVRPVMERSYDLPFERFSRYVPHGTPAHVAAALDPYLEAGCRRFNVVPEAGGLEAAIEAVGELRGILLARCARLTQVSVP